jgi:hypothetical protein
MTADDDVLVQEVIGNATAAAEARRTSRLFKRGSWNTYPWR